MREAHLHGRGPFLPPLDHVVQYNFEPGYVAFTLPAPKRIRVVANGITVADSVRSLLLFESDHLPVYYFPLQDIRMDLFERGALTTESRFKGIANHYSLKDAAGNFDDILWRYEQPTTGSPDLSHHGSFYWHRADRWFEEDEEVFVHARDPFKRVDCLPSSRLVQVEHAGKVLAESSRSVFLFETGLPTRGTCKTLGNWTQDRCLCGVASGDEVIERPRAGFRSRFQYFWSESASLFSAAVGNGHRPSVASCGGKRIVPEKGLSSGDFRARGAPAG